jgi:hypothetical protein
MKARLVKELTAVGGDARVSIARMMSAARLADAPGAVHMEVEAGHLAQLLYLVLPRDVCEELAALHLADACVIVVVACSLFLRVPLRIRGGWHDRRRDGTLDREVGGNGWAQLAGVVRGREFYGASNIAKRFRERAELWIPAAAKKILIPVAERRRRRGIIEGRRVVTWKGRSFHNRRTRVDGSDYKSTGRQYPQCHARKALYFPAQVYRICASLSLTKRITAALHAASLKDRRRTRSNRPAPAYQMISQLRKAAGPKRHAASKRGLTFWSSIAWSRNERQWAENKRLPPIRIESLAQSISKKDPDLRSEGVLPSVEKGAPHGGAGRAASVAPATSAPPGSSVEAKGHRAVRRSSDAGQGGAAPGRSAKNRLNRSRNRPVEPRSTVPAPSEPPQVPVAVLADLAWREPAEAPPAPAAPRLSPITPLFRAAAPEPGALPRPKPRDPLVPPAESEAPTFRAVPPPRRVRPSMADSLTSEILAVAAELGAELAALAPADVEAAAELEAERRWRAGVGQRPASPPAPAAPLVDVPAFRSTPPERFATPADSKLLQGSKLARKIAREDDENNRF